MSIKLAARTLRKNQTRSEKKLWEAVRNRKFLNKKFLRQHPVTFKIDNRPRFFIADFYCAEEKLIIEIDGQIHEKQKDYDMLRADILQRLGYRVIRFKNDEIEDSLDYVLNTIKETMIQEKRMRSEKRI